MDVSFKCLNVKLVELPDEF